MYIDKSRVEIPSRILITFVYSAAVIVPFQASIKPKRRTYLDLILRVLAGLRGLGDLLVGAGELDLQVVDLALHLLLLAVSFLARVALGVERALNRLQSALVAASERKRSSSSSAYINCLIPLKHPRIATQCRDGKEGV